MEAVKGESFEERAHSSGALKMKKKMGGGPWGHQARQGGPAREGPWGEELMGGGATAQKLSS